MNLLLCCLLIPGWQEPAQNPPKIQPPAASTVKDSKHVIRYSVELDYPVPESLDQAITQALAKHPDMRLAEAELRVAEAKLAQARIVVSQKVTEDFHRLEKERADIKLATANWERVEQLKKNSSISKQEAEESQHQLARAKARLATTESSWKLMMGNQATLMNGAEKLYRTDFIPTTQQNDKEVLLGLRRFDGITRLDVNPSFEVYSTIRLNLDAGTADIMDQLKTKLGVKVKLDKQANIDLDQAFQKVTDGAGLKVRVKLPITENKIMYRDITHFDLDGNEYPLHTWLQLIVDEMNSYQALSAPQRKETPKRFDLYVREYGLLLTSRDLAPPDAITVQELWKQAQFEKAAQEAKKTKETAPKK